MSNAERQKRYRDKRNAPTVTESPESVTVEHERNAQVVMAGVTAVTGEPCTNLGSVDHALIDGRGGLADYHANPDKYIPRSEPDKLNWGPWMSAPDLAKAGLRANRTSMAGDWDYAGVCKQVDGEWIVEPAPANIRAVSDLDLQLRLKAYPNISWVNSPEHQEVLKRRQAAGATP